MRQLLWKEWRERRCWLLGWGASIIVLTAWGAFPLFLGEWESGNSWCLPWLMITAMFIGAGAYSSELAPGRAAFAYSRPVSWKAILLSKLLPAFACAGVAVVLGTLLFRWRCPALYLPFISTRALALGAAYLCWAVVGGYLCGLACSVVLAGVAGGMLTLICTVLLFSMAGILTNLLHNYAGGNLFVAGWQCGILLAAVLLLRFGITLPTPLRIARYARVCLPVAGCAMLLALVLPDQRLAALFGRQTLLDVNQSPSARYALTSSYRVFNMPTLLPMFPISGDYSDRLLLRRHDGATWKTDGLDSALDYHWLSDTQWLAYDMNRHTLRLQHLDAHGVVSSPPLAIGEECYPYDSLVSSPDRHYLLLVQQSSVDRLNRMIADQTGTRHLTCVELPALRILPLHITNAIDSWWQSAHEIGYDDYQQGRPTRHIIDLNHLPG